MAVVQQAGLGLGIVGDGKGWSGGATRPDNEASQPQRIKENRPQVFMEVTLNSKIIGKIVLELYGDVVPKTAENFRALCTGDRGISAVSGKPLSYKGCKFHRIIPGRNVEGGDFTKGNGRGGDSIYNQDGDGTFPDENFKLKHDRAGLISMAHKGGEAGKNCSQFFFTTKACPKLDGKHVVFGRVTGGIDVITKLESVGSSSGQPLFECCISDCGELASEAQKKRKRKAEDEPLPPQWEQKESRSKPGLVYYVHESGFTQFERPTSRAKDPLTAKGADEMIRQQQEKKKEANQLPCRACIEGQEVRIWHIMKKHKDFFGKPATSWRDKNITWSKKDAANALRKLKDKLFNAGYGGGEQAMKRKFENYAQLESDDDVSRKVGGDLGPITKKKRLFGGSEMAKAAFELKLNTLSDVIETDAGMHLIGRFE